MIGLEPRKIGVVQARQYRNQLRALLVCSESWLEVLVARGTDGQGWLFRRDLYPPGGAKTLMRECPTCTRKCPPNGADGSPCCDCEIAAQERAFVGPLKRTEDGFREAVEALWWAQALTCSDIAEATGHDAAIAKPKRNLKREQPCPWCGEHGLRHRVLGEQVGWNLGKVWKCAACGTIIPLWWFRRRGKPAPALAIAASYFHAEHQEAAHGHALYLDAGREGADLGGRDKTGGRLTGGLAQAKFSNLFGGKRESGRAAGCQVLLLPESDERLRREIAYYQEKGQIAPSARRYSQANPYRQAPEDNDSWMATAYVTDAEAARLEVDERDPVVTPADSS